MKSVIDPEDEIEVRDENQANYGRIRIRERQNSSASGMVKASIFLTPTQLVEHAHECMRLAISLRNRR